MSLAKRSGFSRFARARTWASDDSRLVMPRSARVGVGSFTGSRLEPVTFDPFAPLFFSAFWRNPPMSAVASTRMAVAWSIASRESFWRLKYSSAAAA